VLVNNDAESLDPRVTTDPVGVRVSRLVHAGLFKLDADSLEPAPYLASGFRWRSARELEVELRTDVQFHSGAPFEAEDVVASVAAYQREGSRHRRVVEAIGEVRAEGAHRVLFRLARDHGTLLSDLEVPVLRRDQAALQPAQSPPVLDGLGPYRIRTRHTGSIELAPSPHAALPTPRYAIVVRTVRDENARAMRMRAGAADVAVNGFSPALLPQTSGVHIDHRRAASLTYLLPRVREGIPLAVRRAISHAWDRAMFARTLFGGYATVAHGLLPPQHWAATRDRDDLDGPYTFDMTRATRELREAGFSTDGADPRLRFQILCSTDRLRLSVARVAAQELKKVGLQLEVTPLELGTLMGRLNAGDFDFAILQMPELTEPNALKTFLHSRSTPPYGNNRGRVTLPSLDAWLDLGEAESDLTRRKSAYAEMERVVATELPLIPLWHEDHVSVTSARAQTFRPSADGRWLGLAAL
jgi:peptide/nickel transport system substrate-binding protein